MFAKIKGHHISQHCQCTAQPLLFVAVILVCCAGWAVSHVAPSGNYIEVDILGSGGGKIENVSGNFAAVSIGQSLIGISFSGNGDYLYHGVYRPDLIKADEGEGEPLALTVNLLVAPFIEKQENAYVYFAVEVLNAVGMVNYEWFKDGVSLENQNGYAEYIIESATTADAGEYWCVVTDESTTTVSSPVITLVIIPSVPVSSMSFLLLVILALSCACFIMMKKLRTKRSDFFS